MDSLNTATLLRYRRIIFLLLVIGILAGIIYSNVCHERVMQLTAFNSLDHPSWSSMSCGHIITTINNIIAMFDFRGEECKNCLTVDFPILHNPKDICSMQSKLDVLLIVMTRTEERHRRHALRQTWLKDIKKKNTGYVFIIGSSRNKTIQQQLISESSVYKDILLSDFIDDYRNLTIKTIVGLKWAVSNCPQIQYILKTDSDILLNLNKWRSLMFGPEKSKLENVMFGHCDSMRHVIREPFSKFTVSRKTYSRAMYPSYCHGPSYGLSRRLAQEIVNVSYEQPFIPMEDAYIGICLESIGRTVYNPPDLNISTLSELRSTINKDPCSIIYLYVIHKVNAKELQQLWKKFLDCQARKLAYT